MNLAFTTNFGTEINSFNKCMATIWDEQPSKIHLNISIFLSKNGYSK